MVQPKIKIENTYNDSFNEIRWFKIVGEDAGTSCELDSEYGIDSAGNILDCDGSPMVALDCEEVAARNCIEDFLANEEEA